MMMLHKPAKFCHGVFLMNLNLMMTSAKVVKTEVTTNPGDHITRSNVTL